MAKRTKRHVRPVSSTSTKKRSYIHDYSYPVFVAVAIPTAGRARTHIRTRYLVPGKLPSLEIRTYVARSDAGKLRLHAVFRFRTARNIAERLAAQPSGISKR